MNKYLYDYLKTEVFKKDKAISFANYMDIVLYHPQFGFYNQSNFNIGFNGAYVTAPTLTPLFAQCFAARIFSIKNHLQEFNILEIGAGSGDFLLHCLNALEKEKQLPKDYFIYERSQHLIRKQKEVVKKYLPNFANRRIHWINQLPENFSGIVIANEVLDALPFHCFSICDNEVKEKMVTFKDGELLWELSHPSSSKLKNILDEIKNKYDLPDYYQSEICLAQDDLIKNLADSLSQGVIFFIDYGYGEREYFHPERINGTLSCIHQNQRLENPFFAPGEMDITAHVNFSRVLESATRERLNLLNYCTQANFLLASGIVEFAAEMGETLSDLELIEMGNAIKRLTFPMEMGERVKVMTLGKGVEVEIDIRDRIREL